MCPAVKLAAKRIPKATGLEILLTISIATNKGDKPKGAPVGINILKKEDLKFLIPKIITPIQILKAAPKVKEI
jgi:hypothetical protein